MNIIPHYLDIITKNDLTSADYEESLSSENTSPPSSTLSQIESAALSVLASQENSERISLAKRLTNKLDPFNQYCAKIENYIRAKGHPITAREARSITGLIRSTVQGRLKKMVRLNRLVCIPPQKHQHTTYALPKQSESSSSEVLAVRTLRKPRRANGNTRKSITKKQLADWENLALEYVKRTGRITGEEARTVQGTLKLNAAGCRLESMVSKKLLSGPYSIEALTSYFLAMASHIPNLGAQNIYILPEKADELSLVPQRKDCSGNLA